MNEVLCVFTFLFMVAFASSADQCSSVHIVSREQWHANPSNLVLMPKKPVQHVFIHHTAMDECNTFEKCAEMMHLIQKFHQEDRKWADIGYNFLVGGDGNAYYGRGWDKVGAHTRGMNDKAVAISLMGNFMKVAPKQSMLNATMNLIDCGKKLGYIAQDAQIHGHRDQNCTECPGDVLYKIIMGWKNYGGKLPNFVC